VRSSRWKHLEISSQNTGKREGDIDGGGTKQIQHRRTVCKSSSAAWGGGSDTEVGSALGQTYGLKETGGPSFAAECGPWEENEV